MNSIENENEPYESIVCGLCGNDAPDSIREAIREGWRAIVADPKGLSWNFVGVCPECESPDEIPKIRADG
jgi:hypothetical protein